MNRLASHSTLGALVVLTVLGTTGVTARGYCQSSGRIGISGGASEQRARIDRAIDSAGALSIEDAISSLSEYNEQFELAGLASLSSSSPRRLFINQLLADRRISKIFGHLLSLPVAVASSQAEKIFDDKFATFRSEWKRFASGDDVVGKLGPCHHAASAGLLLCAYFCPPELLDEKLALWDKAMADKEFEEIQGVWHLSPNRFIDPLFHLNLLVISGDRKGVPLEPLKEDLDRITREMVETSFCRITNLRLFKWDAETMDTDFTHVTRGVPSSGNSVLCELPGFSNPNASLYLQKPERAAQLEDVIQVWRRSK